MSLEKFDLIVIGGGPAGISGAIAAATFHKKVALIEKAQLLGGAGINTGTIPSKTLRESALMISGWRARKLLGLDMSVRREASLSEFTHHSQKVTTTERGRVMGVLEKTKVKRFRGEAYFLSPNTVRVALEGGLTSDIEGKFILIATGSSPLRPPEFMFEHPRIHDSNEILEIDQLPKILAVVGAGVIGSEYASMFAALGVEVHLIDGRDTLLPFLDSDMSAALLKCMESCGVKFHFGERVLKCEVQSPGKILVSLSSGAELIVTDVLVASGRCSNTTELNLPASGVVAGERGLLKVNSFYQTAVPNIYAAGDVIGAPALAGTSMEQARVAVSHAFDFMDKETSSILPSGIYTIPEVSMVGKTEQMLITEGIEYYVGRADYAQHPRGQMIGDEDGFLKLLFRKDNMKLLGVHAIGEQATELIHIGLIAMQYDGDAYLFSKVCFNYPTLGDMYKYAAYDALLQKHRPPEEGL